MTAGTVYLLSNWDGLKYVGVTSGGFNRLAEHAVVRDWWPHVKRAEFEHWPSMGTARVRESQLIHSRSPEWNQSRRIAGLSAMKRVDRLARRNYKWVDEERQRTTPYSGEDLEESWWSGGVLNFGSLAGVAYPLGAVLSEIEGDRLPEWHGDYEVYAQEMSEMNAPESFEEFREMMLST